MQITISKSGRKIKLDVRKTGVFSRGFGLMFRTRKTGNLLFEFGKNVDFSITSFFVFFPFLALWLDDEDKVVEYDLVMPFKLSVKPGRNFRRLVEVPVNDKNKEVIDFFVGKSRKI